MNLLEVMARPGEFWAGVQDTAFTPDQRAEYMATGYTHYRRVTGNPVEMMAILRAASLLLADFAQKDENPLEFVGILGGDLIDDAAGQVRIEAGEDHTAVATRNAAETVVLDHDAVIHARAWAMIQGIADSTPERLTFLHAAAMLKATIALSQPDPIAAVEELLSEHSIATMAFTRDALAIGDRPN